MQYKRDIPRISPWEMIRDWFASGWKSSGSCGSRSPRRVHLSPAVFCSISQPLTFFPWRCVWTRNAKGWSSTGSSTAQATSSCSKNVYYIWEESVLPTHKTNKIVDYFSNLVKIKSFLFYICSDLLKKLCEITVKPTSCFRGYLSVCGHQKSGCRSWLWLNRGWKAETRKVFCGLMHIVDLQNEVAIFRSGAHSKAHSYKQTNSTIT